MLSVATRTGPTSFSARALAALILSLSGACVSAVDKGPGAQGRGGAGAATGGSSGSGGSPSGTGGSGSGGATAGAGGAGGAISGGTGGATGSGGTGGAGGSGGSADAGGGAMGGRDGGAGDAAGSETATAAKFDDVVNNVITNCVFCHPGEVEVVRNSDFADSAGLYDLLLSPTPTKFVPAGCAFKRLVVPGKPMESLLYLKLAGPPAGCGARMPVPAEAGNPFRPIRDVDLELVRSWIAGGAVR